MFHVVEKLQGSVFLSSGMFLLVWFQTLQEMLAETWEKQNGVMCAGMNWEKFTSMAEVQVCGIVW